MSIECTFEEFKKMAREFHVALPTMNEDELDNAWKCLGLAYLGMNEPMWEGSAAIVLQMEMRARLLREVELDAQEASQRGDRMLVDLEGSLVDVG